MEVVLETKNLCKSFGAVMVNDKINLTLHRGEIMAVLGENGSGKTTLLNCISTIDTVSAGHIFLEGTDITEINPKSLARFRRENLGFVFQDFNLLDTLTISENIALALAINKVPAGSVEPRILDIAGKLNISDILNKYPYQVSGGQKQRCACARAIINNPKLLLADEPTGALDSHSSQMLLSTIQSINEQLRATILMVTHDRYFLDRVVRRIFAFENGRLRQYEGGYSDYELVAEFDKEPVKSEPGIPKNTGKKVKQEKLKFTYAEQKEFEHIEDDIGKIEARITEIDNLMVKNSNDFVKLNELDCEKNKLNEELEYKMERWEYLTELDEQIKNR